MLMKLAAPYRAVLCRVRCPGVVLVVLAAESVTDVVKSAMQQNYVATKRRAVSVGTGRTVVQPPARGGLKSLLLLHCAFRQSVAA